MSCQLTATAAGFKVYAVLGNHDRYNGETPAAEILYTARSATWRMPAQNYTFTAGPAQFWALDSADLTEQQLRWLRTTLEASSARWKVVYSHQPLYASTDYGGYRGSHYDKLFPILDGRADVYIAGHHHSMQHLKPIGKLNLFVAGSGGATNYGVDSKDPRAFFVRSTHGFAVLDITTNSFAVRFIDNKNGEVYRASVTK